MHKNKFIYRTNKNARIHPEELLTFFAATKAAIPTAAPSAAIQAIPLWLESKVSSWPLLVFPEPEVVVLAPEDVLPLLVELDVVLALDDPLPVELLLLLLSSMQPILMGPHKNRPK